MKTISNRSQNQSLLGSIVACLAGGALMIGAIWVGPASAAGLAMIVALLVCGALWGAIGSNDDARHQPYADQTQVDLDRSPALDVMDAPLSH